MKVLSRKVFAEALPICLDKRNEQRGVILKHVFHGEPSSLRAGDLSSIFLSLFFYLTPRPDRHTFDRDTEMEGSRMAEVSSVVRDVLSEARRLIAGKHEWCPGRKAASNRMLEDALTDRWKGYYDVLWILKMVMVVRQREGTITREEVDLVARIDFLKEKIASKWRIEEPFPCPHCGGEL